MDKLHDEFIFEFSADTRERDERLDRLEFRAALLIYQWVAAPTIEQRVRTVVESKW